MAIRTKANGIDRGRRVIESGEGTISFLFNTGNGLFRKNINLSQMEFPFTVPTAGRGDDTTNNPFYYGFELLGASHCVINASLTTEAGQTTHILLGGHINPEDVLTSDQNYNITGALGKGYISDFEVDFEDLITTKSYVVDVTVPGSYIRLRKGSFMLVRESSSPPDSIYGEGTIVEGSSTSTRMATFTAAANQNRFNFPDFVNSITSVTATPPLGMEAVVPAGNVAVAGSIVVVSGQNFAAGTSVVFNYEATREVKAGEGRIILKSRVSGEDIETPVDLTTRMFPFILEDNESIEVLRGAWIIT